MSEITEKNDIVKPQAQGLEEAISAWKNAESETLALKQQLEVAIKQRNAAESHVVHLNGALKQCMAEVQQVRDEQEQLLQDIILKKSREWDKVRAELQAKQADQERQLLQSGAESDAMSKSLQERARIIVEVNEAKSRAEAEVKVQLVRLESMEKECSSLRYEIHVLNKELQIRKEEVDQSRKAADAAYVQHLENIRKIAKLESECERLRSLVRKKLAGPAAFAHMRMEVDNLGRNMGDVKRRTAFNRSVSSLLEPVPDHPQGNANKEIKRLKERLTAMEDERKLLKEILAKRNAELQTSRQICARTAIKLSMVEQQLEHHLHDKGLSTKTLCSNGDIVSDEVVLPASINQDASVISLSDNGFCRDDESSCAESWASALVAELAHFKKEKFLINGSTKQSACNMEISSDEYLDKERQNPPLNLCELPTVIDETHDPAALHCCGDQTCITIATSLVSSFAKLQAANLDAKGKLQSIEHHIAALKCYTTHNEDTLINVQQSLARISV